MNDFERDTLRRLLDSPCYDLRELELRMREVIETAYTRGFRRGSAHGQLVGFGDGWTQAIERASEATPATRCGLVDEWFQTELKNGPPVDWYENTELDPPDYDDDDRAMIGEPSSA